MYQTTLILATCMPPNPRSLPAFVDSARVNGIAVIGDAEGEFRNCCVVSGSNIGLAVYSMYCWAARTHVIVLDSLFHRNSGVGVAAGGRVRASPKNVVSRRNTGVGFVVREAGTTLVLKSCESTRNNFAYKQDPGTSLECIDCTPSCSGLDLLLDS